MFHLTNSPKQTERKNRKRWTFTTLSSAGVQGFEPRLNDPESFVLPITPYPCRFRDRKPVMAANHRDRARRTDGTPTRSEPYYRVPPENVKGSGAAARFFQIIRPVPYGIASEAIS